MEQQTIKQRERVKLENKLKWDWWEIIPGVGLAKCLAVNFDNAERMGYIGFRGQLKKHIEQRQEHKFARSIPINMLIYTFYQAPVTGITIAAVKYFHLPNT